MDNFTTRTTEKIYGENWLEILAPKLNMMVAELRELAELGYEKENMLIRQIEAEALADAEHAVQWIRTCIDTINENNRLRNPKIYGMTGNKPKIEIKGYKELEQSRIEELEAINAVLLKENNRLTETNRSLHSINVMYTKNSR